MRPNQGTKRFQVGAGVTAVELFVALLTVFDSVAAAATGDVTLVELDAGALAALADDDVEELLADELPTAAEAESAAEVASAAIDCRRPDLRGRSPSYSTSAAACRVSLRT